MKEERDALPMHGLTPADATRQALTFDKRWARWQAKGRRHDARGRRNMQLVASIAVMIGVIWLWASLR